MEDPLVEGTLGFVFTKDRIFTVFVKYATTGARAAPGVAR
jgi:hypothetical protein